MNKLLIAGLMTAAAVPALAQVAPIAPRAPGAMADRVVTRAEIDTKVRTHFAKVDANRDGFVTTEEAAAGRPAMAERWQRDGIGHTMMIRRGDSAVAFDRIDSNRDGMISRDEFAKGREVRIEKHIVMNEGAAPGQPGGMRMKMRQKHGGMMHGGMMGGAMMLKMADADNDGRVSLAEATSGALRHFDMMDSNRDGRLTPEERRAGRATMMQMRKPG